jgi:NTP pyrophosphatase (non-canonical NTP hydrolase)
MKDIAKQIAKEILAEEKESDFSPHQLLSFYLDELKEVCEIYIEFPGKI